MDIWNYVSTTLLPTLPANLYWLKEIFCIIILFCIILAVLSPFIFLFYLIRK